MNKDKATIALFSGVLAIAALIQRPAEVYIFRNNTIAAKRRNPSAGNGMKKFKNVPLWERTGG